MHRAAVIALTGLAAFASSATAQLFYLDADDGTAGVVLPGDTINVGLYMQGGGDLVLSSGVFNITQTANFSGDGVPADGGQWLISGALTEPATVQGSDLLGLGYLQIPNDVDTRGLRLFEFEWTATEYGVVHLTLEPVTINLGTLGGISGSIVPQDTHTVTIQIIPAPYSAALLSLAGLTSLRGRR